MVLFILDLAYSIKNIGTYYIHSTLMFDLLKKIIFLRIENNEIHQFFFNG